MPQIYTVETTGHVVSDLTPLDTVTTSDYYAGNRPGLEWINQNDAISAATYVNSIQDLTYVVVGPHPHPHK